MATSARSQLTDVPEAIVEAFRESPLIGFPQLAKLLGMDQGTLREHVRAGDLPWRQKGSGKISPRRVFTLSDVAVLLAQINGSSSEIMVCYRYENDRRSKLGMGRSRAQSASTKKSFRKVSEKRGTTSWACRCT